MFRRNGCTELGGDPSLGSERDIGCRRLFHPSQQPTLEFGDWNALLFAVIAMAHGHRVEELRLFAQCVEVDGDAERGSGFVLAGVAATDCTYRD